jgi:hypothetical protein
MGTSKSLGSRRFAAFPGPEKSLEGRSIRGASQPVEIRPELVGLFLESRNRRPPIVLECGIIGVAARIGLRTWSAATARKSTASREEHGNRHNDKRYPHSVHEKRQWVKEMMEHQVTPFA